MKISQSKKDFSKSMLLYSHTDLACECIPLKNEAEGVSHKACKMFGYDIFETDIISPEGESTTGRKQGKYITVLCPDFSTPSKLNASDLSSALSLIIRNFTENIRISISPDSVILIAGLGNRFISSDAIGPKTADKLLATHQLNRESKIFAKLKVPSTIVIAPGVSSQSGIDASLLIKGVAESAKADLIIAIDALAAKSSERLCKTIQISDSGIHPGSGIGNHRSPITKETMGIPVISIGIPTVISSATLIIDALEKAGLAESSPEIENILKSSKGFFVSPGDSDTFCNDASDVLSDAINQAFLSKLYI